MKLSRKILLSCAASLAVVGSASAADLPTRKAAPVQYVRICDAYGAGFFFIPGTDTCLRIGGVVQAEWAVSNTPNRINVPNLNVAGGVTNTTFALAALGGGFTPLATFIPGASRDAVASSATGRVELDARTQSPWGTVRTYMRVVSYFGAGATANTGAIANAMLGLPGNLGTQASRETTILDKGFIQFAGLTAGRVQSFFDFYANAIGYSGQRGSVQTVNALGYTATFGGGFSASLAIEDSVSHRAAIGNTVALSNGFAVGAPIAQFNGTRIPDIVANLRLDQPWGAAQLSAAAHQVRSGLFVGAGLALPGAPLGGNTIASTNAFGFAVQGGFKFNLDALAPGDVLWLQATYAKGAAGYVDGNNLSFNGGVDTTTGYGIGAGRISSGNGWHGGSLESDCVWTYAGTCDQSTGWAVVAAMRHYWAPTVSSTLTANYYQMHYSNASTNPALGAFLLGSKNFGVGVTNYREVQITSGLAWNPIKNFEIGGEVTWQHGVTSRPGGLASDAALLAAGVPAFKSQAALYRGRLRMTRSF